MFQIFVAFVKIAAAFFAKTAVTVAGIAVTYGTIAKLVLVGGSYAYSRAQAKKALRSLGSFSGSRGISIREPAASRRILYGKMRMGGTIVFAGTSGTNNEFLNMVIVHCEGPCQAIGDVYINDEVVPLDGSGNATGKYAGFVTVKKHLGATTQTVDTDLQTAVTSAVWSNNHRLRGICYSYVKLKHSPELFPAGLPNYSAEIEGRNDITDPRDASTAYTTNAALCLRHYLLLLKADGGLGASAGEIDDTAVGAAADICAEAVNLNPSGTEARYSLNGVVELDNEPGVIIEGMRSAMAGICPYVGGKFKMKAGAHTASAFSFTEDDVVSSVSFATRDSMRDAFNGVKGTYVSSKNDYQVSDFPPVVNSTYTSQDGGARIWKDIELGYTTSSATAQRISKIELERSRQDIVVSFTTKLGAINAHVGDVVDVTLSRYGWSAKLFEVSDCGFIVTDSEGGPTLAIRWTLRETAAAVWDWNSGEETTVDLAPNTTLPDLFTVAQMTGLTLSQAGFVQTDGTWQPRLLAKWTSPTSSYIINGGAVNLEYKATASVTWLIRDGAIRGDATDAYITDVTAGASTDVRGRFENVRFVRGAYSSTASITANGAAAPATVTGLTSSTNVNELAEAPPRFTENAGIRLKLYAAKLTWNASASTDLAYYEINYTTVVGVPKPNFPYTFRVPAEQTYAFVYELDVGGQVDARVRAANRSGGVSAYTSFLRVNLTNTYGSKNMADQENNDVNVTGGAAVLGGFEANVTTAVDVKAVNLRIFDSGSVQKLRVDNTTGDVYVQNTKVLSTRVGSTPVTVGDVIAILQHHGLSD
jgi:hypothetical protein